MIGSTPLPSTGGSGPAYDDTAVRERLDVVERNRSIGDPVVAEIVSLVTVDETTTFSDLGLFYVDVQLSDGASTASVAGYDLDPVLETFAAAVAARLVPGVSVAADGARAEHQCGDGRSRRDPSDHVGSPP